MSIENKHILLVDDDTELSALLAKYLQGEGFSVSVADSGEQALEQLMADTDSYGAVTSVNEENHKPPYDAVVLDIMMPGMSGLEVLNKLRSQSQIPVVMLTGRGDDIDRILGLEMGADDYLGKPCNPRELSARLKAVLRRYQAPVQVSAIQTSPSLIELHGLYLDSSKREASIDGSPLNLTSAEFNLLQLLAQTPGQVQTKHALTEHVLGRKLEKYDRSIDVHISRVRHKLQDSTQSHERPIEIKSIRGRGYQLIFGSDK